MELKPAPTSPKVRTSQPTTRFEQPRTLPWLGMILLMVATSLIVAAGALAGLAWLLRSYPDASWLRPWSMTSTTVIEQAIEPTSRVTRPGKTMAQSFLIAQPGNPSIVQPEDIRAIGLPLSSNGWIVTLTSALPTDGSLVVVDQNGDIQAVTHRLPDPAGVFTYIQIKDISASPVSFVTLDDDVYGQRLWLGQRFINATGAVETRLGTRREAVWESSDKLDIAWSLASGQVAYDGAPVLDDRGYVYGLATQDGHIWPTAGIESILKTVLQNGSIERPTLGIHAIDTKRLAMASGLSNQGGWLVGQVPSLPAVEPNSPADAAKMKAGDQILMVDGQAVSGSVWVWMQRYHPGQKITVTYRRDAAQRETTIELGGLRP